MPLRTKLLLSLVLIAVIPLILFGFTAYQVSTNSLMSIERDNLEGALDSTNRALLDIQHNLARYLQDYCNWDDLHNQSALDAPDMDWIKINLAPETPTSTYNTFNLNLLGLWNHSSKLLYSVGPIDDAAKQLDAMIKNAPNVDAPQATLVAIGQDVYLIGFAAIRNSEAKEPNGVLLFGRKLGADDVAQIKALTGYDVALYKDLQSIAATDAITVTPLPDELRRAAAGNELFNQTDANAALAFKPVQDEAGNTIMTVVVWRSRSAVVAAQASIASTLALWFGIGALLAVIVALILGRSIARPLIAMANTADKMASGDLSQRVAAPSHVQDELGRLANAFNQMASKVGARVTESESENERLQAIDEYRLNLLTAITQALHTPLNTVKSHSEALELAQYGALNDAQKRSAGAIHRAAAVQEALLADLLDFAKAQQKQLRLNRERVRLNVVVNEVMPSIQQRYAAKHIQFNTALADELPPLFADATRVEQILDNLLDRAFDFTLPGGRVELSARPTLDHAGTVEVSISDTSTGLSNEEKAKLFELFYTPTHNGSNGAGHGLGLAFVKALLEQQGGTIRVDTQQGKGNTFTFTLPSTNF